MYSDTFLILHGWGGNKPAHWQEHLANALTSAGKTVHYPKMPDPTHPNPQAWMERLHTELAEIGDNPQMTVTDTVTVIAHSLGAILWMHHTPHTTKRIADRVLLVAPPYVLPQIPPSDAPPGVPDFFPPPMDAAAIARAARETHIIASDSDDYATFEQTKAYADRLSIPIHLLPGAGHISPYWGYGEWQWVTEWALGTAQMPPLPRVAE